MIDQSILSMFNFPRWGISSQQQSTLLHVAIALSVLSAAYALWLARRERDGYPVFVFLGAGLAVLYEPLGDILSKVAYPPLDQISLMISFGRPIPLWMLPNYFFFFCVPVLLLLQFVVRRGVSARRWFLTYCSLTLLVALFEQPGINADAWRYYGAHRAFAINSYPVWVAFVNAETLMMLAVGIHLLRRTIISARTSFLFVILVPILLVGSHVGPAIFVASAMYSGTSQAIINAAALLTISSCLLLVSLALVVVRRRSNEIVAHRHLEEKERALSETLSRGARQ